LRPGGRSTGDERTERFVPTTGPTNRNLELIGPVYEAADDPTRVGLRIDERHTSGPGLPHAGLLVAVADTIMGHAAQHVLSPEARRSR